LRKYASDTCAVARGKGLLLEDRPAVLETPEQTILNTGNGIIVMTPVLYLKDNIRKKEYSSVPQICLASLT